MGAVMFLFRPILLICAAVALPVVMDMVDSITRSFGDVVSIHCRMPVGAAAEPCTRRRVELLWKAQNGVRCVIRLARVLVR